MKNGGPAFPHVETEAYGSIEDGMSLRDYFAAAALQGLIARCTTQLACEQLAEEMAKSDIPKDRAEWFFSKCAYHYADAMLKARDVHLGQPDPVDVAQAKAAKLAGAMNQLITSADAIWRAYRHPQDPLEHSAIVAAHKALKEIC